MRPISVERVLIYKPPVPWARDAACRGKTRLMFTEGNGRVQEALKMCAVCPVREQCGFYGHDEHFGIWGGEFKRSHPGTRERTR